MGEEIDADVYRELADAALDEFLDIPAGDRGSLAAAVLHMIPTLVPVTALFPTNGIWTTTVCLTTPVGIHRQSVGRAWCRWVWPIRLIR